MFINRPAIKYRAKGILRGAYWKSVLVSFILFIISADSVLSNSTDTLQDSVFHGMGPGVFMSHRFFYIDGTAAVFLAVIVALIIAAAILLKAFVINPIEVGCKGFFLFSNYGNAKISEVIRPFSKNYTNQVYVLFMRDLFIFLWSLLFIIPGIIKAYSYRLVPYILAEHPDMDMPEALRLSKSMMYGYKWQALIFDVSFIGWTIFSSITFGLVGILFANPYYDHSAAQLYLAINESYSRI